MLVQTTPVSSLTPAELQSLISAAPTLIHTNEASQTGIVKFNGRNFRVNEVRSAMAPKPTLQMLNEIIPQTGNVL